MAAKTPVEKLPLAVRKNVRDEFEAKRPDLEAQFTKLLGEEWKIDVNPNLIYAYAEENSYGQSSLGSCIWSYFDGAIYRLKYFLESSGHGTEGASEINTLAHTHTITLYPDLEKKNSYCGVDIKDGVLRILFKDDCLGTNISNALEDLPERLNEASIAANKEALPYSVRDNIKKEYTGKIDQIQKGIAEQLHNPNIKLNPNFEANSAALKASKDVRDDWQTNLGDFTRRYFDNFLYYTKYNKFSEDDLLYEGFEEAVEKGELLFRIVDKLTGDSSYNQILVEDGVFVMQTTPSNYGTNIDNTCSNVVDIL